MDLQDQKVLVIGCGISGMGAARLLSRANANVILYDENDKRDVEEILGGLPEGTRAEVILGEWSRIQIRELKLAVISPGVPMDIPMVEQLKENGVPVWGEVELAWQMGRGKVLAITGTNGKTTTTALLGEIVKNDTAESFVVGNIGTAYTEVAAKTTEDSVIVAEMSSFQLEGIVDFHPVVSAVLNISPDHLNRHHTMENYINAKKRIALNQTEADTCVLNYEDEVTRKFGEEIRSRAFYFSSKRKLAPGVYLSDDVVYYNDGEKDVPICNILECNLLGLHNYENIMAAVACAVAFGIPTDVIRKTVTEFRAVEHRIEFVTEKNGVVYYNDSKGTNPDAAIKGIQAMTRPTCLIGGGYDKDSSYEDWIRAFDGKVKLLVLIGATREKIAKAARGCGFEDIAFADTLEEAVNICATEAEPGDAVLLSPACASWGMFTNYEERGKKFKEYVNNL